MSLAGSCRPLSWTRRRVVAVLLGAILIVGLWPAVAHGDGPESPLEARMRALWEAGERDAAVALADQALVEAEAAHGPVHADLADVVGLVADFRFRTLGDAAGARPLYARRVRIREELLGPAHLDVATALVGLGQVLFALRDLEAAREAFARSLAIRRSTDPTHPRVAQSLNDLGATLWEAGDLEGAQPLWEQSLAIREAALGPEHRDVAEVVNNLANLHRTRGDFPQARALFERALSLWEADLGPEHPLIATGLGNLGALLEDQGRVAEARPQFARALAILEKAYGPDHPEVARAQHALGVLLGKIGAYDEARSLLERSLAVRQAALPTGHPATGQGFAALGALAETEGDYAGARPLYVRAVAILEGALGADHPYVATTVENLANLLVALGDGAGARAMLERALAIRTAVYGPDHPEVGRSLGSLAELLAGRGDFEAAGPLAERSLAIQVDALGEDHLRVASSLATLGQIRFDEGDPAEARILAERALAVRERALGPDHPAVARDLTAVARYAKAQGDLEAARALYLRSLAIRERAFDPDHPVLATTLNNLAVLANTAGDPETAVQLHGRSLAILEARLGPDHPRVADNLSNQAQLWMQRGDLGAARPLLARSLAIREAQLPLLDTLAEREALAYLAASRFSLDLWLAAHTDPDTDADAWQHVLRWKGAVSRRLHRRASLPTGPELEAARTELGRTRRALARLVFADMPAAADAGERADPAQISATKEALERQLASALAANDDGRAWAGSDVTGLCEALPAESALVDVLQYAVDHVPTYLAFVLRSADCVLRRVDLGPADAIDDAVAAWREALAAPEALTARIDRRGAVVTERLWVPLAAAVGGAGFLLLVPDGPVAAVPFAALPLAGGGYLVEHHTVAYLDHATDVLRPARPAADGGAGALVIGDLDFDPPGGDAPTDPARFGGCVDAAFAPLPGAAREVESVAHRWRRQRKGAPVDVLTGHAATEGAVTAALPGRELVHIATHGFFATGRCRSALARHAGDAVVGHNPMLLSGLVLSGANGARDPLAPEDGLLTAEEVATLSLRDTRLVVLSACETGLGEVRSGDGVLGLRRAFAVSGARSLIMSLWSVPDEATAVLMDRLYGSMLRKRRPLGAAEALREAQLAVLRAEGDGQKPQDWAAFLVAGDWR